jgi:hypothetical protein
MAMSMKRKFLNSRGHLISLILDFRRYFLLCVLKLIMPLIPNGNGNGNDMVTIPPAPGIGNI